MRTPAQVFGQIAQRLRHRFAEGRREVFHHRPVHNRHHRQPGGVSGGDAYGVGAFHAALRRAHHRVRGADAVYLGGVDGFVHDKPRNARNVAPRLLAAPQQRLGGVAHRVEQIAVRRHHADYDAVNGGGDDGLELGVHVIERLDHARGRLRAHRLAAAVLVDSDGMSAHYRAFHRVARRVRNAVADLARAPNRGGDHVAHHRTPDFGDFLRPFHDAYHGVPDELRRLAGNLFRGFDSARNGVHRRVARAHPEPPRSADGGDGGLPEHVRRRVLRAPRPDRRLHALPNALAYSSYFQINLRCRPIFAGACWH